MSTESLGLVRRLVDRLSVLGAVRVALGDEDPLAGVPNRALRRERTPNAAGARLVGYDAEWGDALRAAASAAVVIVLDAELDESDLAALQGITGQLVVLGTVASDWHHSAALVLPVTNMAEENGTYVNRDGRLQRFQQARAQPGMARPAWWVAGEVLGGPGPDADAPATAAEAFDLLAARLDVLSGLSHAELGFSGRVLRAGAAAAPAGGAR
jgi:hypothetical protein